MKNLFFVIFACCSLVGAANAQNKTASVTLDTVKTFFDDGSLSRVYTVIAGTDIREGVSLSYHPGGVVAIEAPYKNGKLDGVFRSHYANGKLWQTIGYKDGIEEGISTDYYESGTKRSKEIYKNGVLDGLSEEWYESGVIRRKMPYSAGQVHGKAQIFDELGALKEEMEFDRGLRHGAYRRYNKGVKVLEAQFERNRCVKNCDF